MGNATINRIDTTISVLDQTSIDAGFTQINTAVSIYAKVLTQEERESLFSAAEENLVFITETNQQAQILNAQFGAEMQLIATRLGRDLTLGNQFNAIEIGQLAQLNQKVKDTKRLAFHEAYVGALALYKFIEAGAEVGLPGFQAAFDALKSRFAGQGQQGIVGP